MGTWEGPPVLGRGTARKRSGEATRGAIISDSCSKAIDRKVIQSRKQKKKKKSLVNIKQLTGEGGNLFSSKQNET